MKEKNKKKRRIFDIIRIVVLLVALSVLLYPTISNYLYEKNSSKVISSYDENVVKLSEKERKAMLKAAQEYNKRLSGNTEILDPFSPVEKEENTEYESLLNVNGAGMMGYIKIPKINVELPIYHGTTEAVLQAGVGHFEGTSLPVGGESTHTVLTGHRGLPSKMLFTDLDELEIGDIFYLDIVGEKFAYQVDQILTVLPEDTKALSIEEGKDYATLVTCTPYAVNTHRLLIRGHRIPYKEAIQQEPDKEIKVQLPFQVKVLIGGVSILVLVLLILLLYSKKSTKKNKKIEKK